MIVFKFRKKKLIYLLGMGANEMIGKILFNFRVVIMVKKSQRN